MRRTNKNGNTRCISYVVMGKVVSFMPLDLSVLASLFPVLLVSSFPLPVVSALLASFAPEVFSPL